MRTVTTATPVQTPAPVNVTDAQLGPAGPAPRFQIWNSLARVFGDLFPTLKRFSGKAALAVDW